MNPRILRRIASGIICFVILATCSFSAYAAGGDLYDNTNGLITANVNDACQTTDGFIWIAQYEGLSVFDGVNFRHINRAVADGTEIALEQLTCVEGDSQNNLYIGTKRNGVVLYAGGEYHRLTEDTGLNVNDISVNEDTVYVATTDGAYYYRDGEVVWLEDSIGSGIKSISGFDSMVFYADVNGVVYVYDGSATQAYYNEEKIRTVRAFEHVLWLGGSYGELIRVTPEDVQKLHVVTNQAINALAMQYGEWLFIGTDNGLYVYDNNEIIRLYNAHTDTSIQNIFFDYEHSMWLSTPNGLTQQHRYPIENISDTYGVNTASVNACFLYQGLLYVGTDQGLYIIDDENGTVVENALSEKLKGIRVRDFQELDGKLYVATYSAEEYAVLVFDGKKIQLISAQDMLGEEESADTIYRHGQVRRLCTMDDKMLIGTNYGVTLDDHGTYKTVKVSPRPLSISVIGEKIYVCTDGDGIHVFDKQLQEIETVPGTAGETPLCVIPYGNGILYGCGTGLFYAENGTTTRLNTTNVGSVVELRDIDVGLIMYTSGGVTLLDKDTLFDDQVHVLSILNATNGMNSGITANGRSVYLEDTKTNYFNGTNGVYKYNRTVSYGKADALKLAVESIREDGKEVPVSDSITVDKHNDRLTVELALLTYLDRRDLTVYYQMVGMDKEVSSQDFSSKQSIDYTNLRGGTYTLEIYAENAEGARSNEIDIEINKPLLLYENRWAQIVAVILLLAAVAVVTQLAVARKTGKIQAESEWRKQVTIDAIEAIAHTIDAKDDYTKGHSIRVAKLACCIAEKMGKSAEDLEILYYIGLLHDVGKVGVPDSILTKPGRLTNEEFAVMKTHPAIGHMILRSIKSIPHLEDGVMYHHEKYDGTGYPNGLKGEEIPQIGRIICVADCYDVMATKRCYKEGFPEDRIVEELQRCSGTQFDPNIVECAVECIRSGEFRKIVESY